MDYWGEGSVFSVLKKLAWATGFKSVVQSFWGCLSLFTIRIKLTERGLEHIEEVGEVIFTYLRLLQATPPEDWVFDEMRNLSLMRFRYQKDLKPYDLVTKLSCDLQDYPPEHVMTGPQLFNSSDAVESSRILEQLTVNNLRLVVWAKKFVDMCNQTDPWYGAQFHSGTLTESWRQRWEAARNTKNSKGTKQKKLKVTKQNF